MVDANGAFARKQALAWAERYAELGRDLVRGAGLLRRPRGPARCCATRARPGSTIAAGEYALRTCRLPRTLVGRGRRACRPTSRAAAGITGLLAARGAREAHAIDRLGPLRARDLARTRSARVERLRHLEYFHDHVRIERMLFDGVARARRRRAAARTAPARATAWSSSAGRPLASARSCRGDTLSTAIAGEPTRLHGGGATATRSTADASPPTCARRSRARSASTPAPARSTRPTPRTTGRRRSASSSRATWTTSSTIHRVCREHGAPIVLARRRHEPRRPDAATRPSSSTSRSTSTTSSRSTPTRRVARVQPGLRSSTTCASRASETHGLTFGPDPSTHAHCTLGGMIGNNSCGLHSVQSEFHGPGARPTTSWSSTSSPTTASGCASGATASAGVAGRERPTRQIYASSRAARPHADEIRTRFPKIPRRVSGYNLDELLPENGFNVARALVGTEGTCVTILEATLELIPKPPRVSLLVLGYADSLRSRRPRHDRARARADLPRGDGRHPDRGHGAAGIHQTSARCCPTAAAGCWSSSAARRRRRPTRRRAR